MKDLLSVWPEVEPMKQTTRHETHRLHISSRALNYVRVLFYMFPVQCTPTLSPSKIYTSDKRTYPGETGYSICIPKLRRLRCVNISPIISKSDATPANENMKELSFAIHLTDMTRSVSFIRYDRYVSATTIG